MTAPSYPVQLVHLAGRRAVVIGGGHTAAQKVGALLEARMRVHVIAPDVDALAESLGRFERVVRRTWREGDLDGAAIVIAATNDREVNRRVAAAARARGVLVNAVDDPVACDFFLPAVVRRGPVSIAIGTDGRSPLLAGRLRRLFEALLPDALEDVAELLVETRRRGLRGLRRRGVILRALADSQVARLVDRGDRDAALDRLDHLAATEPEPFEPGTVAIVGAGPAGRALLTVRALDRIQRAEVVLYDKLVTDEVLAEIAPGARRVCVGRRAGDGEPFPHALTTRMMIAEARAGRRVVRLHAGDAFVFGRGGEELDALDRAGVAHEVVPGISAAVAAPAAAGVPLTHRALARGFTVRTGHVEAGPTDGTIDRSEETQIVLMGLSNVDRVLARFAAEGFALDTPAVMVGHAFRDTQRVATGTIASLAEAVRREQIEGPATLIVGRVAARALAKEQTEEVAA